MKLVEVAGADPVSGEVAVCLELGHDSVRSAFGYFSVSGYLAQAHPRLLGDARQNARMIGKEIPVAYEA